MRSSKVNYISTSKTEAFTMVTSHTLLIKMSNFVMRRGHCINSLASTALYYCMKLQLTMGEWHISMLGMVWIIDVLLLV